MNVLVCGADGFLGARIADALSHRGHNVVRGVRTTRRAGDLALDYSTDTTVEAWLPRLAGIDAVVNAVGILREQAPGDFERIHTRTPTALFEACKQANLKRVIQISALGNTHAPYHLSKHAADAYLEAHVPQGVAVRPGLVFGAEGTSTGFFLMLASMPLQLRLGGAGPVQPVDAADLTEVIVRLIEGASAPNGILETPGPKPMMFSDFVATYRAAMGFPPALGITLPEWAISAAAKLGGLLPNSLLTADTWRMLKTGNVGEAQAAQAILGRPLRSPAQFVAPENAEWFRLRALSLWRGTLTRVVLALIWLITALTCLVGPGYREALTLLTPFGLTGAAALCALYGAIGLDLLMAFLTLRHPGRRLWLAQLALVGGYTLLVAWKLPFFLIHPLGPILKNLAVAVLLIQLWSEETAQ